MEIIQKYKLERYDDNVNDMNFFSKFKYTSKGPHSIGSNNSNNIGIRMRSWLMQSYVTSLIAGNF